MKRRSFVLAAGAFIALAAPARAHAMLERAEPPVGARVPGPVRALRLRFTEALEPALSRVTLLNGNGAEIAHAPLTLADRGKTLIASLPAPLAPGAYRVRWRAVSVDTHTTEGDYAFSVRT